uniref:Transposase n=1 Tax=Oncorhynchus kisutch TaxID=8019 RepID=A0A8C7JIV9_ONCKI
MLTERMSTRAVAREFYVNFSTISRLQRRFREFGSTSNRPHNLRPRVTMPAQDRHIRLYLWDRVRPATWTADETLRSISVWIKTLLWVKTHSDWLGQAHQWVDDNLFNFLHQTYYFAACHDENCRNSLHKK